MAIADGQVLTAADFLPYAQLAAVATTFTPTWGGVTLGNGATGGWWAKIGALVHAEMYLDWGYTTSVNDFIRQPLAGLPAAIGAAIGHGWAYDDSALVWQPVSWRPTPNWITAAGARLGVGAPWTWGTYDNLTLSITYLAAP